METKMMKTLSIRIHGKRVTSRKFLNSACVRKTLTLVLHCCKAFIVLDKRPDIRIIINCTWEM